MVEGKRWRYAGGGLVVEGYWWRTIGRGLMVES